MDEHRADRAARGHFAQLLAPGGMERTAVVVETCRCAIEQHRNLALEVQAPEIVHAQRRCMQGLAHEYRRRLDLRLRGIETRLGQEQVLETTRDAASVAIDGDAQAVELARRLETQHALEGTEEPK